MKDRVKRKLFRLRLHNSTRYGGEARITKCSLNLHNEEKQNNSDLLIKKSEIIVTNPLKLGIHIDNYTDIFSALDYVISNHCNVFQIYLGDRKLTTLSKKVDLSEKDIVLFKQKCKENGIQLFVHSILTLNFCKDPHSDRNKWGITNLVFDMNVAHILGASGVVLHANSYKTKTVSLTFDECLHNFVTSLKLCLDQTRKIQILIETPVNRQYMMAGTLETLAKLYHAIEPSYKKRVKICIDTQHIFASDIDVSNKQIIQKYFEEMDKVIGLKNVKLIHLNDSLKEYKSGIDRHESIGKGYIFSKNVESLKYIVNSAQKRGIPLVLETGIENVKHDLQYIRKTMMSGGGNKKDIKEKVIQIFKDLLHNYEYEYSLLKSDKRESILPYKIESYKRAIVALEKMDKPIYDSDDVKDTEYIGKSFREKIDEIALSGSLSSHDNIVKENKYNFLDIFETIWGVGKEKAMEIVNKNITTLDELRKAIYEKKISLTSAQLIGLKYYEDLKKRISRQEITKLTNKLKKLLTPLLPKGKWQIHNAGSYRMGEKSCGDIDFVVSYSNPIHNLKDIFYEELCKKKIIIDTLSSGDEKSIYIIRTNSKYVRKMDVSFIDEKYLVYYLFYFGKGRDFSKKSRTAAAKKGYKLTDKGLFDRKTGVRIDFEPKTEENIMKFIM
jgi:apurinic endonuclease APN1